MSWAEISAKHWAPAEAQQPNSRVHVCSAETTLKPELGGGSRYELAMPTNCTKGNGIFAFEAKKFSSPKFVGLV